MCSQQAAQSGRTHARRPQESRRAGAAGGGANLRQRVRARRDLARREGDEGHLHPEELGARRGQPLLAAGDHGRSEEVEVTEEAEGRSEETEVIEGRSEETEETEGRSRESAPSR